MAAVTRRRFDPEFRAGGSDRQGKPPVCRFARCTAGDASGSCTGLHLEVRREIPMSLAGLGMTESEEHAYRSLLRDPDGPILHDRKVVERLIELELLSVDQSGRVVAVDPEIGVARLIRRRLNEADAEMLRITAAWRALPSLVAGRGSQVGVESVERIDSGEEVGRRVWALGLQAQEVLGVRSERRMLSSDELARCLGRLAQGPKWRTVIGRSSLRTPELIAYATQLHRAGDLHRVIDNPIQQMVIIDRSVAFVPITPNSRGVGALVIRQAGAVATLVDLFESIWAKAVDLEPAEPLAPTPLERQVLYLLNNATKDEIAAREMMVSVRTYRRHVAGLLSRLGAASRFQAALLARERGWI
ncbi:hypothetical protein ACIBHX_46395 [Nonomuraea sp. NPDC050536]|uniref:hypothetical protein n=1 Tax=Nonomuraea sp. NPDC050536 TaxID=3364366 RepID=UPI0037CBE88E